MTILTTSTGEFGDLTLESTPKGIRLTIVKNGETLVNTVLSAESTALLALIDNLVMGGGDSNVVTLHTMSNVSDVAQINCAGKDCVIIEFVGNYPDFDSFMKITGSVDGGSSWDDFKLADINSYLAVGASVGSYGKFVVNVGAFTDLKLYFFGGTVNNSFQIAMIAASAATGASIVLGESATAPMWSNNNNTPTSILSCLKGFFDFFANIATVLGNGGDEVGIEPTAWATISSNIKGVFSTLLDILSSTQGCRNDLETLGISDAGKATIAHQLTNNSILTDLYSNGIGLNNAVAASTDTIVSSLNGRLQRIAQRLTTLISLLPSALINGRLAVDSVASRTAVVTQVSILTTTTILLAENLNRKGVLLANSSANYSYVRLHASANFSYVMAPYTNLTITDFVYTGMITGYAGIAGGIMGVTELT